MRIIRVFLASTSELKSDREEFEIFIARENKSLIKNNLFLELVIWEDFINSMSKTRLQDEYNKAIQASDIFIMLFFTKVGKYALEEFVNAFEQYKGTGRPLIYTFFKNSPVKLKEIQRDDFISIFDFQKKLRELGHFESTYENINSLKMMFSKELNKLQSNNYFGINDNDKQNEFKKNMVFISYSHQDKQFLERLLIHLKPLSEEGLIEIWDDTKLNPGDEWKTAMQIIYNTQVLQFY